MINELFNGKKEIEALMPSGLPALLMLTDDGIIVTYIIDGEQIQDIYTPEEFEDLEVDEICKEPPVVIESLEDKLIDANKLSRIQKSKNIINRQYATGLLDRMNLGVDDRKEVKKFIKKVENEDHDPRLTDINDLDFPDDLQNTVPTNDEGEVITIQNIASMLSDLKTEIASLKGDIQSLKVEPPVTVNDEQNTDIVDVADTELVDEPNEPNEPIEDTDDENMDNENTDDKGTNDESEENEETEETEEDNLEESLKKYLISPQLEDLTKTKQEIDKMKVQGKDAKDMRNAITLMSDDDDEEEQAREYAIEKLKEELYKSNVTCEFRKLKK